MDSFVPALEELSQALTAGEDPEQALAEIAEDHSLAAHALRNRAVRAFGPLETYKGRQAALKQERQRSALRSDPALAAASFFVPSEPDRMAQVSDHQATSQDVRSRPA
jgi:hypothetical protein